MDGVVDLIKMKACYFDGESGETVRYEEIPDNLKDFAIEKKLELLSVLADFEESMEEYFLEEKWDVPEQELKDCIRKHTINLNFSPVFMGSAFKNKGV